MKNAVHASLQNNAGLTSDEATFSWGQIPGVFVRCLLSFVFLAVLLGLVYPAVVTGLSNLVFPQQAHGSLVEVGGKPIGSALIGQDWTDTGLFEGRPSATNYNASSTSGSNLAMSNPDLTKAVKERVARWQERTGSKQTVPLALVTASSSGLDPDIPVSAALYQIPVVAKATGLAAKELETLIAQQERSDFLSLGEEKLVNVLELNVAVMKAAHWTAADVLARLPKKEKK